MLLTYRSVLVEPQVFDWMKHSWIPLDFGQIDCHVLMLRQLQFEINSSR
jgi:hypothetical protein